jgi:hypothetical protein
MSADPIASIIMRRRPPRRGDTWPTHRGRDRMRRRMEREVRRLVRGQARQAREDKSHRSRVIV